ncbi:nose resistant to fluoxetine protein 6-like [Oppia nitens]|uniref:nose resistant to fluoxetine protein 6-like n=1 Tax=Oppia nitens TaxID=1686743 RepID=UPI0023DA81F7|nr:nose resistant to fluoxetine protein 6-like [Oppia nitens]
MLEFPHIYQSFAWPDFIQAMEGFARHYWQPFNYIQTYIIGMITAYAVRYHPKAYLGGRIGHMFIWIVTISMTFSILYWQRNFVMPGYLATNFNDYEMPLYLLLGKPIYLLSFVWLVYSCSTGRGGKFNEMLGWKGFKIIDNLGLEIYIMHVFFFVYRIGSQRELRTYTEYYIWSVSMFDFFGSYVLSVITAFLVTRPFTAMTNVLLKPKRTPKENIGVIHILRLRLGLEDSVDDNSFDENGCSADDMIDFFVDKLTPDDYEESKQNIKHTFGSLNETIKAFNRLEIYGKNVSEKLSKFTKRMNSRVTEVLMEMDLEDQCMQSLARIMNSARDGEIWAIKFFEAQPTPSNGILELSGTSYGNYDQCLSIESPDESEKPKIYGQYCGIKHQLLDRHQIPMSAYEDLSNYLKKETNSSSFAIYSNLLGKFFMSKSIKTAKQWQQLFEFSQNTIHEDLTIINGLCLPSTCKPKDVSRVLTKLMYPITHFTIELNENCDYKDKPIVLNKYHIVSIVGVGSLIAIFILSTIIDCLPDSLLKKKLLSIPNIGFIIKCFSGKSNAQSILGLQQYGKFKALDGFRAILTFYCVVVHTYEFGQLFMFTRNHYQSSSYKMILDYRNMFLPNILIMDNFVLLSGFLLCNTILSRLEQSKGRFNYLHYLLIRYLRLLPIILFALFITFLFEFSGSGPHWKNMLIYFTNQCYDKWHKPLLMTTNILYYPNDNSTVLQSIQCLGITWYSSLDFQLYALAPIAFLVLYKYPRFGLIWLFILLIFGILLPIFNHQILEMPHVYQVITWPDTVQAIDGFARHYWQPFNYIQTYIIGMITAYAVRYHPKAYLGGRIGHMFIWIFTICMTFSILYWQRNFVMPGYLAINFNDYEMPLYLLLGKPIYMLSFVWLVYSCSTGRGGKFNEMLGWKGFKVIDNLGLEIYIMHVFFFVYRIGSQRELRTYTEYYIWSVSLFDFVGSYVLSVITAFLVTRPFTAMTNVLLKPKRTPKESIGENVDNKSVKLDTIDSNADYMEKSINNFPELTDTDRKTLNFS